MVRVALAFSIAATSACAISQPQSRIFSVEELAERSGELNGQFVKVRGWIEIEPETFRLWETAEAMDRGQNDKQCVGITVPKGLDIKKFDRSQVIVRGEYISDVSGRFVVLGGCRARQFILLTNVESVASERVGK